MNRVPSLQKKKKKKTCRVRGFSWSPPPLPFQRSSPSPIGTPSVSLRGSSNRWRHRSSRCPNQHRRLSPSPPPSSGSWGVLLQRRRQSCSDLHPGSTDRASREARF
ncbi:hypothetical protein IE53DRAFT_192818 [Violaceomyces palustris]|uniref:Uncharacterized protein n=1 Tax=Violaceomyces palustris TaxID=1673888 RepID=A0ACD0NRY9_9BASI|nr:hypothetical protein IE53DRAFT_192818 [Violaceomyces palustris]